MIYQVRNFNVEAGIRPDTIYAKLEIGKACLEDKVLNSSDCPNIIIGEYLKIDYDQLPAPKLEMKSGAINIVVNLESLLTVSNEFSSAVSKQIDLSKYYDIASSKTSEYIKMGEKYVKSIAKTGSQASIELKIDMKAPVIFIPYDIQNLSEGMLVLDGGQFCADTEVVEITGFEFDKYKFSLSRTEISVIWDCENINSWKSCKKHDFLSPVDYNFTLLNCKEKQNLVPGFQLATSIGRLSFELDEQLIYFTLTLKDRLLATLNKASTLEAPEAKKRGDSLVVETEALKDKMKRINDIIALKTSVEFEEISLRLRQAQGQLASMKFSGLRMDIALGSLGEVIGNLKLNSIEMIDLRHNVQLRNVIYNPILNTVDEDEFNDALEEEIVQFLLSFELRPKQDFLSLNLKFSEMRIMPSPDLLSDVMKFFTRPISRASVLIKSTSSDSDVEIPIISSKYRTIFNTKASIQLSNFEI